MIAVLRRWWRPEKPARSAPDDRFVAEMRQIRAETLPRQRALRRELRGRGECPLVRDVFPDRRRREDQ